MAIYHFSASIISRSSGRSATAAAAYRAGEKIIDERTGEIHDYTHKKGVDSTFILAPNSAPDWVFDREKLWNEVEKVERRKDSQLAREINVALPTELTKTQQLKLVRKFVTDQFVNQGMVADVAFHDLDTHNPHAHIMLTMREIDEQGFSLKKNRDWNRKELLEQQRKAWAISANQALEQAGVNQKIDHRSLEEQGINRLPQIHLGANVNAMMKRGIATERGDTWLAINSFNQQLATLETEITTHKIAFEFRGLDNLAEAIAEFQDRNNLATALEPINQQLANLNHHILARENEIKAKNRPQISSPNQPSPPPENPYRTKYLESAQLVRQKLGTNISSDRLDLEIYLRTNSEAERVNILGESDFARFLKKEQPPMASHYLRAIAKVANTYKSLSDSHTPNLDTWAKKMINVHLAKFHLQENNLSQNLEPQKRKGRGRRM